MKFSNRYFFGQVSFKARKVVINLQIIPELYHTRLFAGVVTFLRQRLPAVLKTKCHNPDHLPFKEEVKQTEFGHLFEHVLLTLLCDATIKDGAHNAYYSAYTEWDWRTNQKGTFTITINSTVKRSLFALAFKRATTLSTALCECQVN